MTRPFTHLHVHSEYSLLDGFGRIEDMVSRTAELGMDSLAITDHGVLFGAVEFSKACKAHGIKGVIGCEVYVAPRSLSQKESGIDSNPYHLVLLAENKTGYRNLCKIVSKGFVDGFYYKPRVDHETLRQYHNGIICLSACIAGEIPQYLIHDQVKKAEETCLLYRDIFGPDHFYLEIQDHRMLQEAKAAEGLTAFSEKYHIPMVVTNDAHYVRKEDARAHDVLLCIQTASSVADEDRMRFPCDEFYLKSPEEMAAQFPTLGEALENTHRIAMRCDVDFEHESAHMPDFELPEAYNTAGDYVRALAEAGLAKRYDTVTPQLQERLDYELSVIHNMGFDNYFLVVWDFIKYAKDHGIMVGPGRGSAAGSLVAYALDITTLDPIKYNLLFERFLNPERVSMPDIDCDFCYERRQEVIDYVVRKYGEDRVAQIITFGTMAARGAVRDVGRAMGMGYAAVDRVAKEIPIHVGQNVTIAGAMKENPELSAMAQQDPQVAQLLNTAQALEGLARHASTHAAGVVIADAPLTDYVPLYRNGDAITTQYTMGLLEDMGLIKMDFLGLRTLTVIRDAVENIRLSRGTAVDVEHLSMDDPAVYAMLASGDTLGVFQLESRGMMSFMRELVPENFEDLVAGISLYRPGPMDQIPRYIANKKDPSAIRYLHPLLEPILNVTYGCMVYQEQVMQIFRDLAGFSMGRSDLVRRAMSKKKTEVMDAEGEVFIHGETDSDGKVIVPGAVARGVPESTAIRIYGEMKDFAKYAFNKSHAAAYAVIAYQTAWLKYYYPTEFMAALMSSVMDDEKKVSKYIGDCKKMGIQVVAPDVNRSYGKFSVTDGKIIFGLGAVKGLGAKPIESIVGARDKGPFTGFRDFCERVDLGVINRRAVEGLIKAGAFDFTGTNRAGMLLGADTIMAQVQAAKKDRLSGQISLLDMGAVEEFKDDRFPEVPPLSTEMQLAMEKEVLGLYVSGHPLQEYQDILSARTTLNSAMLSSYEELCDTGIPDGGTVVVGGLVDAFKSQTTKAGKLMGFLTLEDLFGKMEVVVFPAAYEKYRSLLTSGVPVMIRGRINYNEEMNVSVICNEVTPLAKKPVVREAPADYSAKPADRLILSFSDYSQKPLIARIKPVLGTSPGPVPVVLRFEKENKLFGADRGLWVTVDNALVHALQEVLGQDKVEVK